MKAQRKMMTVKIREVDDIKTAAYEVGVSWFGTVQMPWHGDPRVVADAKNQPIPHISKEAAVSAAKSAVIGLWRNHCVGTKDAIVSTDNKNEIEKVFGKQSRRRNRRRKRR